MEVKSIKTSFSALGTRKKSCLLFISLISLRMLQLSGEISILHMLDKDYARRFLSG